MWISKNRFQELEGRLAMAEINIRALAESKPTNRETIAIERHADYNSMRHFPSLFMHPDKRFYYYPLAEAVQSILRHLNLELKFIPSKNAPVVLEPIKPDSPSEAL